MRCPRPDIIVILAVLVAAGVLMTTTAEAQGAPATPDLSRSTDTTCLLLCSHGWRTGWLSRLWHPGSISVETGVDDKEVAMLDGIGGKAYYGGGVHYDFMFNRVRAVMMGGDMDVTLRLGNYHHPIPAIDPYLSISLGRRW